MSGGKICTEGLPAGIRSTSARIRSTSSSSWPMKLNLYPWPLRRARRVLAWRKSRSESLKGDEGIEANPDTPVFVQFEVLCWLPSQNFICQIVALVDGILVVVGSGAKILSSSVNATILSCSQFEQFGLLGYHNDDDNDDVVLHNPCISFRKVVLVLKFQMRSAMSRGLKPLCSYQWSSQNEQRFRPANCMLMCWPELKSYVGLSINWGVLFVSVVVTRALLFGVRIGAPDFGKLPSGCPPHLLRQATA